MTGVGVPVRLLQARRMQGGEMGIEGKKKRGKKGDMTGNTGKREKRQSFDPGRE